MQYNINIKSPTGCISEGDTKEEALENIKEAIELYLEPGEHLLQKTCVEIAEVTV
jgi:predicted RNase H-like HicB family nuclease